MVDVDVSGTGEWERRSERDAASKSLSGDRSGGSPKKLFWGRNDPSVFSSNDSAANGVLSPSSSGELAAVSLGDEGGKDKWPSMTVSGSMEPVPSRTFI